MRRILYFFLIPILLFSCNQSTTKTVENPAFELLDSKQTGISFNNQVEIGEELNIFNYMYFYNGGGVGAGDFNNDGLADLFFTANLGDNELYLNKGNMQFDEATEAAGITQDGGWSTGVSVVDINNDGLLDIYVSQVGDFKTIKGKNQLFVCQKISDDGVPIYEDEAAQYGLDMIGFCTQAAFFDYDLDGDLDLYQMNHSLHANGTFGQRAVFQGKYDELTGDKIFRNDNGTFTNVTKESGINSWVIGYGLGLAVGDINLDGYPDVYIGNDFHENDYLYINQKDGTFKEQLTDQMMHTSRFSMGVDIGDLNNDAQSDIISLDMLPYDPYILKKSEGEDAYGTFQFKLGYGYNHQYAKNALQVNNGNGTFSEVAMFGGVHATDWSWASLLVDFDNDGQKDMFISNGIPKRMNDIDYINFVTDSDFQWKSKMDELEKRDLMMIQKIPEIKLPNQFFRNKGQFQFDNLENQISNDKPSFSNGAIYADLDNDGDLDIVTNNVNAPAFIYENKFGVSDQNQSIQLTLNGTDKNKQAIGSKVVVRRKDGSTQLLEHFPTRGFQSSMNIPLSIGLGDVQEVDKIELIWPDNTVQTLQNWQGKKQMELTYQSDLPAFDYQTLSKNYPKSYPVNDRTAETNLDFTHKENPFVEFNREPLIPHSTSTDGPALAVGDLNNDGKEDLFFGSSKRKRSQVFLRKNGKFELTDQPVLVQDSTYEHVDAVIVDVNNDGNLDVVVATGGNEYSQKSKYLEQLIYLNDGTGQLSKYENAIPDIRLTASSVAAYDFTGDGFIDLFFGGRAVPSAYGETPKSYLLKNDGTGKFQDVTADYSTDLSKIGFVQHATWTDLNQDKQLDLVLALEWGSVVAFMNNGNAFNKTILTDRIGWWNFTTPYDFDNDGDIDLIAGNLGYNSRLKASDEEPIRMYYADMDGNGKREQILTYYLQGREVPFSNKMELQSQMPVLKKTYLKADDFAKASLGDLFGQEKLQKATTLEVNDFSNVILVNNGDGTFETKPLPLNAQWTSYKTAIVLDANGDDKMDVMLGGNYYNNNIQMGRLDADYGTLLINKGNNDFEVSPLNGVSIKGQIRRIKAIDINGEINYVIARNNDTAKIIEFEKTIQ